MWDHETIMMIVQGVGETLYMTVLSTVLGYLFGLPMGVLLAVSDKEGLKPNAVLYKILDAIANIVRSIPFLILLILLIPFTRAVVGKSYGSTATVVPLVVAAIPFIARMVESSIKEVDAGVIEAARAMGASNMRIIVKVLLVEARTSLITGATIAIGTILGYSAMSGAVGGGGLATGVSTLAKLLNPNIKVIGVEPAGANCLQASLKNGKVTTLPTVSTIADGTAVKTPGTKVFPYLQKNLDDIITVPDEDLIVSFLDMVENHKMIVENSGLLTVAALKQLKVKDKKVVSILSGGNMDVITMSSVVQQGLVQRSRIFTVSVLLPDKPGELVRVAQIIANANGNVIKLDHNQFVSINRKATVELRITIEAFGHEHKDQIVSELEKNGLRPRLVKVNI